MLSVRAGFWYNITIYDMLIEQPPLLYRLLFPEAIWRIKRKGGARVVYLTFDDGPIPEETPWVLDLLDRYGIKATFFMVGDNVRRHPELLEEVRRRGHSYGNHTMHHLQGMKTLTRRYLRDIAEACEHIDSPLSGRRTAFCAGSRPALSKTISIL